MTVTDQTAGGPGSSRARRFYQNPVLRDREWAQAKQAPWWLTVLAIVIVGVSFYAGFFRDQPENIIGWIVGLVTIVVYAGIQRARRNSARRRLRALHEAST